uniref:Uncharacterized protein n=1 Tax=Glossina pallidipes TaxID=7398 RepID=A0A1B0AJ00_GLOPL
MATVTLVQTFMFYETVRYRQTIEISYKFQVVDNNKLKYSVFTTLGLNFNVTMRDELKYLPRKRNSDAIGLRFRFLRCNCRGCNFRFCSIPLLRSSKVIEVPFINFEVISSSILVFAKDGMKT